MLENDEINDKDTINLLTQWIDLITSVLSIMFTVRSVFNLLFVFRLIPSFYPATIMNPVSWDAFFQMFFELIPILVILVA
jgi:hypothetical protein